MKLDKKFLAPFYPFAGFAVAWYCFMPNFILLFSGIVYRSQLAINIKQLINSGKALHYRITQPKTRKYKICEFNAMVELSDKRSPILTSKEPLSNYQELFNIDLSKYFDEKCGEPPKEGT